MKLGNRRHIASWLLLAVFVPMLLMTSLHVHESTTTVETECSGCIHNSCHGHLTQMASWTHDCVLCQFLTLSFTVVAVVSLLVAHKTVNSLINTQRHHVCIAYHGIVGLRAPPAFSI